MEVKEGESTLLANTENSWLDKGASIRAAINFPSASTTGGPQQGYDHFGVPVQWLDSGLGWGCAANSNYLPR